MRTTWYFFPWLLFQYSVAGRRGVGTHFRLLLIKEQEKWRSILLSKGGRGLSYYRVINNFVIIVLMYIKYPEKSRCMVMNFKRSVVKMRVLSCLPLKVTFFHKWIICHHLPTFPACILNGMWAPLGQFR